MQNGHQAPPEFEPVIVPELNVVDCVPGHEVPLLLSDSVQHWLLQPHHLPQTLQIVSQWSLVYSTELHGYSLKTLLRRAKQLGYKETFLTPCLMLMEDHRGRVIGVLLSELPGIHKHFKCIPADSAFYRFDPDRFQKFMCKVDDTPSVHFDGENLFIAIDHNSHSALTISDGLKTVGVNCSGSFEGLEAENIFGGNAFENTTITTLEFWILRPPFVD